ncbi:RING finger protein conserved [Leptomonas seymouri]|uniref:RING finger protein conserved n=1 Tax=Leptomonas seymouri TaxID=5684 RepID=A0A0N1I667_LEPSE|nr:RING finger protein conserved [Leptomonas seymouri]|eukprot:KPI86343.1 RING finger protein conserved [Leptomonas seymouri]
MVLSTPPSPSVAPSPPLQSASSCDSTSRCSPSLTLAPLPAPPSLASFSFSQLLSFHDEALAGEEYNAHESSRATLSSTASTPEAVPSTAATAAASPSSFSGSTFSFEDCVRFRLCLTCALCGRLLRHHPAAIETCGHCFCYSCINTAVEDGCLPLAQQWPWSRLSSEVEAAAARWTAATAATHVKETGEDTHGVLGPSDAKRPERRGDNSVGKAVVTEVSPMRKITNPPATAATRTGVPPHRPRATRKVRQRCPLCLGPAFKWMLVSVPAVAELCTQLSTAYPALEDTLTQLTCHSVSSCVAGMATQNSSPPKSQRGEEGSEEQQRQQQSPLSAAAFKPSAPQTARESGGSANHGSDSSSERDARDEEAVRQQWRRSGGPRKEITFADEVRVSVKEPQVKLVECPFLTDPLLTAEGHCVPGAVPNASLCTSSAVGCSTVEDSTECEVDHSDISALPATSGGSASLSSTAASALQLSVDLIPSPNTSAGVPSEIARQPIWRGEVVRNGGDNLQSTQPPSSQQQVAASLYKPSNVLGQSPGADDQSLGEASASGARPYSSLEPTAASQVPYLSETLEAIDNDVVDAFSCTHGRGLRARSAADECVALKPSSDQPGSVLFDTPPFSDETISRIMSHLLENQSGAAANSMCCPPNDYTFVYDGANTNAMRPIGHIRASQYSSSYSSVRALSHACHALISDAPAHNATRDAFAFSGNRVTAVSVHPCDVWELDAAHLQRHPDVPNCFVALRVGHLKWCNEEKRENSSKARRFSKGPPLLCVTGNYPPAAPASEDGNNGDGFGARKILSLSPAVCTAAVLAVPCVDIEWFSSRTHAPWKWYAATAIEGSSGTAAGALALPSSTNSPSVGHHSPVRQPGSWMASTRRILLASGLLRPRRPTSFTADRLAPGATSLTGQTAFYFFLLPDDAALQFVRAFFNSWSSLLHLDHHSAASVTEAVAVNKRTGVSQEEQGRNQHHHLDTPRKRRRDSDIHSEAWDTTDGYSQRAWRRLVLTSGGAVVEMSASLFAAIEAAALESGGKQTNKDDDTDGKNGGSTGDRVPDVAAAALASHVRASQLNAPMDNWLHVDIDEGFQSTECASALADDAQPAQHVLFLLYSPAVVQKACDNTLEDKAIHHHASNVPKQTTSADAHFRFEFQRFLMRVAAFIASMLTPILPETVQPVSTVTHEVRPARWLLESIMEGHCSADSSTWAAGNKPRYRESQLNKTCSLEGNAGEEANNAQPPKQLPGSTQQMHWTFDDMEGPNVASSSLNSFTTPGPPSDELQNPQQRVGVYRALLYSDTP